MSITQHWGSLTASERDEYNSRKTDSVFENESIIESILEARAILKAPQFRQGATLEERASTTYDRLGKGAGVLIGQGWGATTEENIEQFRQRIEHDPEGVEGEMEGVVPGALQDWNRLKAEATSAQQHLVPAVAKILGPILSALPIDPTVESIHQSAHARGVLQGLSPRATAGIELRDLDESGRAGDILDGCKTEREVEEAFQLRYAEAPQERKVDEHAHKTDEQLEAEMDASAGQAGYSVKTDRPLPEGVSFEMLEHSTPERAVDSIAQMKRDIAADDAARAAKAPASATYARYFKS